MATSESRHWPAENDSKSLAESRSSPLFHSLHKTSAVFFRKFNYFPFVSDLAAIRKILENETGGSNCPSCKMPFDKGKKRKLIDTCGHDRCYSCMFKNESCTICANTQRQIRQEAQRETSSGKLRGTRNVQTFIRLKIFRCSSFFVEFCMLLRVYIINDYLC